MKYAIKALKWAYGDSLQFIAFALGLAAFVEFLQALIVYPVQVLATLIIGTDAVILFTLVTEWS